MRYCTSPNVRAVELCVGWCACPCVCVCGWVVVWVCVGVINPTYTKSQIKLKLEGRYLAIPLCTHNCVVIRQGSDQLNTNFYQLFACQYIVESHKPHSMQNTIISVFKF